MNLFTRNSPYYHLLNYLLFLLKHPVYMGLFSSESLTACVDEIKLVQYLCPGLYFIVRMWWWCITVRAVGEFHGVLAEVQFRGKEISHMMTHPFFISFLLFLPCSSSTFCNPLGGTQGSSLTCPTPSHAIPKLGVDRMTHFEGTCLESQRICRYGAWLAQFTSLLHCPRSKCMKPKIRQSHSSSHVTVSFSLHRKVAKYLPHWMAKMWDVAKPEPNFRLISW